MTFTDLTLTAVRAVATGGNGCNPYSLQHRLLIGVRVGNGGAIRFRQPVHNEQAKPDAPYESRTFRGFPTFMATQLVRFSHYCFLENQTGYSASSLAGYLSRLTDQPNGCHEYALRLNPPAHPAGVRPGRLYAVSTCEGELKRLFVGLGPRMALCVLEPNGALGVCRVADLMTAHEAGHLDTVRMMTPQPVGQ